MLAASQSYLDFSTEAFRLVSETSDYQNYFHFRSFLLLSLAGAVTQETETK